MDQKLEKTRKDMWVDAICVSRALMAAAAGASDTPTPIATVRPPLFTESLDSDDISYRQRRQSGWRFGTRPGQANDQIQKLLRSPVK